MDSLSHNPLDDSIKELAAAMNELSSELKAGRKSSPLEQAVYALMLRQSRSTLRRLQSLDSKTPPKPQTP